MGADRSRLGRQLLATRNRLRDEQDLGARLKLLRREVRLLVSLGDMNSAAESADRLLEENPHLPAAFSIKADLACRNGNWQSAEELFGKAEEEYLILGDTAGAERLGTGPLFRLAEARGDFQECRRLCNGTGDLKTVLAARCARLSGSSGGPALPVSDDPLAFRLSRIEASWRGGAPRDLLDLAVDWQGTEPEWRWRLIVEGIELWKRRGLNPRPWKRPVRETVCPVLDPRFHDEWRQLSHGF